MNVQHTIVVSLLLICVLSSASVGYNRDMSKHPIDKAVLPARLENMRPGQIRDAAESGAPVILPVATVESAGDDSVLGIDRDHGEDALMALAKEKKAVIAPTVWYGPNGKMLSGPADGTVDIPTDAFAAYIKDVMLTLTDIGFKSVLIVPLHNPQGDSQPTTPMMAACLFAMGDIFNDYWRDPKYGAGWWDKPGAVENLPWHPYQFVDLPAAKPAAASPASAEPTLPMRLENMRPSEVKKAIAQGLPLFLPVGVLETHGNHNPVGVDAIEAQGALLLAAGKVPAVIAPTVWFGPTATACGEPKLGNTDIGGVAFQKYIDGVIRGLADLGFKTLTVVQCHQGGGAQRTGICMAIQQYRARLASRPGYGPGWAKRLKPSEMTHCEVELIGPPNMPSDHAGKNETSWMLGLRPDYVDMKLLRPNDFGYCWTKNDESNTATYKQGNEMVEKMIIDWCKIFKDKTKP